MYKAGVVILLVAGLLAGSSCRSSKQVKKKLPGLWQVTPVTIDGSNKDWPSPYPYYDDKAQLGYAVSNDKENLYITVETGDPATQLKIMKKGLTVWIDKEGGTELKTAINYPIPTFDDNKKSEDNSLAQGGHFQQSADAEQQLKQRLSISDKVRQLLLNATEFSLEGFKFCNYQFPVQRGDSCGIVVHMGMDDDNELVWEAVVPFKTFYPKATVDKRDMGRQLSICIETTELPRPAGQHSGGGGNRGGGFRPSVGMGGGMGMGFGGGMHRGGGGGNRQSSTQGPNMMEPAYKSTKTWKHFGIAYEDAPGTH